MPESLSPDGENGIAIDRANSLLQRAVCLRRCSLPPLKFLDRQPGLLRHAPQRAHRHLPVTRHDDGAQARLRPLGELDMAAALADLLEPRRLKPPLDLQEGSGLSGSNLDRDGGQAGRDRGRWFHEVERQRLLQIGQRLGLALALAGHIHLQALDDHPVSFPTQADRESSPHGPSLLSPVVTSTELLLTQEREHQISFVGP